MVRGPPACVNTIFMGPRGVRMERRHLLPTEAGWEGGTVPLPAHPQRHGGPRVRTHRVWGRRAARLAALQRGREARGNGLVWAEAPMKKGVSTDVDSNS